MGVNFIDIYSGLTYFALYVTIFTTKNVRVFGLCIIWMMFSECQSDLYEDRR